LEKLVILLEMWFAILLLITAVEGALVVTSNDNSSKISFPATIFMSGPAWNDDLQQKFQNATIHVQGFTVDFDYELCFQARLVEEVRPHNDSINPILAITYLPSCYPEEIARVAARYGFAGLVIGTPSLTPGIFSVIFWKNRKSIELVPIPILETPFTDSTMSIKVSLGSLSPDDNYFRSQQFIGITEFFNCLMIVLSLFACWLGYLRLKANWTGFKTMNLAVWICLLEFFGIAWKFVLCIDTIGVLHLLSFPMVLVIQFFSLFPGMISTYLVSMRLHLILSNAASNEISAKKHKTLVIISVSLLVWFLGFELYSVYGISTLTVSQGLIMIRIGNGAILQLCCLGFFVKARLSLINGLKRYGLLFDLFSHHVQELEQISKEVTELRG
jgi:hypothetical protein